MEHSENVNDLLPALLKARSEMNEVYKTQLNQFLSDKNKKKVSYANLTDYIDASIEALTKNGLIITQTQSVEDGKTYLVSTLFHVSGQFVRSKMILPTDGGPQIIGGLITYFRKYQYGSLLNLSTSDDDDGNKAQASHEKQQEAKKTAPVPTEEKPDPNITDEQFFELEELIDRLPKERRKNFLTYATNAFGQLSELKTDQYEKVKGNLIRALNEKPKAES